MLAWAHCDRRMCSGGPVDRACFGGETRGRLDRFLERVTGTGPRYQLGKLKGRQRGRAPRN